MARYVALLRAINVGGHTVKMERLRALFQDLGFANVETFIASGNVVFESRARDITTLERKIEAHLESALGYEVKTFVRSMAELVAVVESSPFIAAETDAPANVQYVAFMAAKCSAEAQQKMQALCNPVDDFQIRGRELYWLRRRALGESVIVGKLLEKTLAQHATARNMTTVRKLVEKYGK